MQLPHLFKKPAVAKPVYFFAIHLSDLVVQSALWKVDEGMIEVVSRSGQKSWSDDESCVAAIDQTLQELSKESEHVTETLFALSPEWVTPEGILPGKKPLFQKITKELSLEAIGFVVTTEALLQHFTQTLSPQLSLFLIEVAASQLFITQVKQGSLQQTEKVGRSGNTVSDLVEAFAHFKDKVFPSKFLLYSSVLTEPELEEIRQALFGHDWPSDYPFLHPPVIDIFAPDHVLEIIIQTGGRAVAESKGLKLASLPEVKAQPENEPSLLVPNALETTPDVKPVSPHADDFTAVPVVAKKAHLEPEKIERAVEVEEDEESNLMPVSKQEIELGGEKDAPPPDDDDEPETVVHKPRRLMTKHILPFLAFGIIGGLLLLWGIGTVFAQQAKQATITLQLNTKAVSKDVVLTLDPTAPSSDPTKLLMKAEVVTKDVQGTKTAQSTGSKIIGDKAKGSIKLYNRTSSPKTFSKGTTINSDKLKFTLDSDTTIASASSGTDPSIINVGTADASITAAAIGTDSNLAKDVDLTIDTFSKDSYFARTSSALTGGTSREILAVSAEDQTKLKNSLLQDLTAQAATEFKADSNGGTYIVPTNQIKITKSTFSADVGKETDSFSLTLQATASGLTYLASDLRPLATQLLSADIPDGYQIKPEDIQVLSNPVLASTSSAQVNLQTNVSSVAVPTLDLNQLKQTLAGKSPTEAEGLLKQNAAIKSVTIKQEPPILNFFSSALPKKLEKITITVGQ